MKSIFKKIPWYGYLWGIGIFVLCYVFYSLGNVFATELNITPICTKVQAIDDAIKLIPFFVIIYFYSYIFWIIGPIAVSTTSKQNFYNFLIGIIISLFVGFLFFCFCPTYMSRTAENLYTQLGNDIFSKLIKLLYANDGGNMAFNLFPSYHCLISFYCYLGVAAQKEITFGYRLFSFGSVVLITLSTLFTKQHYFLDIIAGFALALFVWMIIKLINPGKMIIEKQNKKKMVK